MSLNSFRNISSPAFDFPGQGPSLRKQLILSMIPTVVAIVVQKTIEEYQEHRRATREAKLNAQQREDIVAFIERTVDEVVHSRVEKADKPKKKKVSSSHTKDE